MSSPTPSPPQTPRFRSTFSTSAEEPFLPPPYSPTFSHDRRKNGYFQPTILRRYIPTLSSTALNRLRIISFTLVSCLFAYLLITLTAAYIHATSMSRISPNKAAWDVDVVMFEKDGSQAWTVHIPEGLTEPLKPKEYRRICENIEKMQHHGEGGGHRSYYWRDKGFVDPAEETEGSWETGDVCETSMTYILQNEHRIGLGVDLMSLWTAYGLAQKEGRAFFVDDRDWAWGKYSDYFLPPTSSCKPPPPHLLLSCPHQVKHLVVMPATNAFTFGHAFNDEFEDPRKMYVERQHKIFALARSGYEDLFRLNLRGEDEELVETRKNELLTAAGEGGITAIHVRRGDGRARNQAYHGGYIPPQEYVDAAANISSGATMVIASDDSEIYSFPELAAAIRAQEAPAGMKIKKMNKNIPDQSGFVKDQFLKLQMRPRVESGRVYLRDLKILGELASSGNGTAVCGWNSMTCRVLAVVMGWEKAIGKERWRNVDGEYQWRGVDW